MNLQRPESDNYHELDDLIRWQREIAKTHVVASPPNGVCPNPCILNDMVVASVMLPGQVIALARTDGRKLWQTKLDSFGDSHVTVADQRLYVTSSNTLFAISPDDGTVLWSWTPYGSRGEWIYSSPLVVESRIIIGDRKGVVSCLDTLTGTVLWQSQTSNADNRDVNATATIVDDYVITATNAQIAVAYELSTGRRRWKVQLDGGSIFQLQLWNNRPVIQGCSSVSLLDHRDGRMLQQWSWQGRRVHSTVVAGDMLVSVIYAEDDFHSEIQGYDQQGERFKLTDSQGLANLRYDPRLGVLYETRFDGIGIIVSELGRRVHHINEERFHTTLPTSDRGLLYCLGQKRKYGLLIAMEHPCRDVVSPIKK